MFYEKIPFKFHKNPDSISSAFSQWCFPILTSFLVSGASEGKKLWNVLSKILM